MLHRPKFHEVMEYGNPGLCSMSPPAGLGCRMLGADSIPVPPPPLSGMTLWLQGNDNATAGNDFSWPDHSGNGNPAWTGSGPVGQNPTPSSAINGQRSVSFVANSAQFAENAPGDPSLGGLLGATGLNWSAFVVFNYTGTTAIGSYATTPGTLTDENLYWGILVGTPDSGTTITVWGYNYAAPNEGVTKTGLAAGPHIAAFIENGTGVNNLSLAIDGGTPTLGTGTAVGGLADSQLYVGHGDGNPFWQGAIGDVIVYDRTLSSAEQTTVVTYLGNKYGITV